MCQPHMHSLTHPRQTHIRNAPAFSRRHGGWYRQAAPATYGIGLVCGQVSGGLEALDFDDAALYPPWCELVEREAPDLLAQLVITRTPKGYHVRYRCSVIEGNIK